MSERIIVTSALPYANGPIHFGHAVGAYLPADIYVRFRRMRGDQVHFVCGTDEHGVAITLKAEQQKQGYAQYVDHWHQEIRRTLEETIGIRFDVFSGTAKHKNPFHEGLTQEFFLDLQKNGYLLEKTEEQYFSASLGRFLPDRYVEGGCYVCGYETARGDECPKCGSWLDAKRLVNPRCTLDGQPPVLRPSKHWYLDLDKLRQEWLQGWFESKRGDFKPNVRNFVEEALKDLRERPITRDLPWGVPVPLPNTEGKVIYVWFDAPIGYLSISKQWFQQQGKLAEFESWWKGKDTKLYHFIGKDNITFHALMFPAMLWGTKKGWIVPTNVPANEFFNLEGRKFNTSKGWYIPEESVRGKFTTDALRYALTTMMPETADSDWSWKEFQARVNADLADNLGNFVARTLRFAERYLDGKLPAAAAWRKQDLELFAIATDTATRMEKHLLAFEFREAMKALMALGNAANKYYDTQAPWVTRKSDSAACNQAIRTCAEIVRTLAVLCAPVMPQTSAKILSALGLRTDPTWADAAAPGLPAGVVAVQPMEVLFTKIEDKIVDQELARLKALEAAQAAPAAPTSPTQGGSKPAGQAPAKDAGAPVGVIPFETFAAVDLRVGRVSAAEKHKDADKLLVLQVDLGTEIRTICAGIASAYKPEELVGRKVVVVANLAPRKLRGIDSQGMLLASDDADGKPRLIQPDADTPLGTKVK